MQHILKEGWLISDDIYEYYEISHICNKIK
jgi:hypothetical protein